ncbi:MAG: hypothetical protein LBV03_01910 [Fusobacteriales bacterium]|jgi:hypothetical protein|nr:hypothetical protein [Fusobacteriales bacterium]
MNKKSMPNFSKFCKENNLPEVEIIKVMEIYSMKKEFDCNDILKDFEK